MAMLLRLVGIFIAFLAAWSLSFALESSSALVLVALVALAAGFTSSSVTVLAGIPAAGTLAYLVILLFVGQLGPVASDSVEGFNQVIANSVAAFLVFGALTFSGVVFGSRHIRRWRAV